MWIQAEDMTDRQAWLRAAGLAVVIVAGYLFMATRATLWDRDEPRFARATAEMVESGDYLVPTFNGELRPDKPILIYWLMSLPMRLWGPTELACRFFAAVGTALTALLVFFIGKRLFDAQVGLTAMVMLALSLMVLYIGSAATADAVLLPFMVGQMAVFVGFRDSGRRVWAMLLMALAMGGALLAKGPVGLLPLLAILVLLWFDRRDASTRWRVWELGLSTLAGIGLFLAWALPANAATHGEFLRRGIGHHVLARSAAPLEHHGGDFLLYLPYYLPVILVGFFPWTLYMPAMVSVVGGRRLGGPWFRRLFFSWTLPLLMVMTLVATKLPHYILFMWPALALAGAGLLWAWQHDRLSDKDRLWLQKGVWFFAPVAVIMTLGMAAVPWLLPLGTVWTSLVCAAVMGGMSAGAIHYHCSGRVMAGLRVLGAGMSVFMVLFCLGVVPKVEATKISPEIARIVRQETGPETPVATFKYEEPSLNFYIGRPIEPLKSPDAVLDWLARSRPGALIVPRDKLEAVLQGHDITPQVIGAKEGYNFAKGRRVNVVVVRRDHSQPLP